MRASGGATPASALASARRQFVAACLAVSVAGCGSSAASSTGSNGTLKVPITTAGVAPLTPPRPAQGFELLADSVCAATREGMPRPLAPPFTPSSVARYSHAASAPARRTFVSLGRLTAPRGSRRKLASLTAAYGALVVLYDTTSRGVGARQVTGDAEAIRGREGAVTALARAAALPACAFVGP